MVAHKDESSFGEKRLALETPLRVVLQPCQPKVDNPSRVSHLANLQRSSCSK